MPPTQQDLFRDRRQMIGYNDDEAEVVPRIDEGDSNNNDDDDDDYDDEGDEEDEHDDQPFDCYNEEAALEAARRYSPWKDNTGKTVASVTSPNKNKTPKRSKSRPWRVDVMLRKGKGVERTTTTWKQQMKERKQVFQWSGVTVVEDQSEDSVFQGVEEDEISKGDTSDHAGIGNVSPSNSDLPEVIDCTEPEVIDCCTSHLQMYAETMQTSQTGSSAICDFQNAMRALEQQLEQDSTYIGSGDDDDDDDDDDAQSVYSVRSLASAVYPSAPERQEQRSLETTRRDVILSLEGTFIRDYDPYERYTITTTGRAGLDPPKQVKNEYHTVFQRFQRSRLAKELAMTVSLLPTKHFHVVEELTEADIARLRQERTTLTAPLVRSKYRVATNEQKQEPPVSASTLAPTEHVVPTSIVINHPDQAKQIFINQEEGQITALSPEEELKEEPKAYEPSVVSQEFENTSNLQHNETVAVEPEEAVSIEPNAISSTLPPVDSQHDTDAPTTDSVAQPLDKPSPNDMDNGLHQETEENPSIPSTTNASDELTASLVDSQDATEAPNTDSIAQTVDDPSPNNMDNGLQRDTEDTPSIASTTNVSEELAASQQVTERQNDSIATQPIHTDSSPAVDENTMETPQVMEQTTDMTSSPSIGKKSKADKWKDRIAKRKSGIRRDSDISNESAPVPPSADTETKALPPLEIPQLSPEQAMPASPPAPDDTTSSKEKRKSMKWKQRLAEKKGSKGSPTATQHKLLSETGEAATSEPLKQIVEVPVTEDISMEEAAEEAYKQLMGDLLTMDVQVDSRETTPENDEKPHSPAQQSNKPADEVPVEDVPVKPDEISKPDESTLRNEAPAIQPVPVQAPKPTNLPTDLRNSFMAFDALLRQRQGDVGVHDDDADEYTEYTIEEVSIAPPSIPTATKTLTTNPGEVTPAKSVDYESIYEEITVEQSYMEYTVDDGQDSGDDDSHESPKPTSTPLHASTTNLMNSRMFSTPQVAKEPTITVQHVADDEMTVLTFDQSYIEPIHTSTIPEAFSPPPVDKLNDSGRVSIKDTIGGGTGTGANSMQGSRKRDSISGSHRSFSSKTSATSDKSNKAISDILRKDIWSKDVKVVAEALEDICMEASRGQKARSKISQFGGIMAIVRAMESHRDVEIVQVAGCNALDRLALDPDTQVVIGEMGGIVAILDAMKTFDASADVHQAACAALANITRHRGTTDEVSDAVHVLCASMGRHASNMQVQAKAFGAIANICMDNKQRLRELSDAGGMLTMTMALQQPWPNKAEKHEAISNLSILLRCMAEHEESGQEEEYEGYHDDGCDANDLMSVISALDDELMEQPLPVPTSQETHVIDNPASPANDASDVQCLQKIPRMDRSKATTVALGLEQGSNSTQPTEPTAREHDDENCTIS